MNGIIIIVDGPPEDCLVESLQLLQSQSFDEAVNVSLEQGSTEL
jgi:hypothetical protein